MLKKMSITHKILVIRYAFLLIFILIAFGVLQVMASNPMAQDQTTGEEPNVHFLKIEIDSSNLVAGKLELGKFREGEPMIGTTTLRLVSSMSPWRVTQSPMKVKIAGVQASGFMPTTSWYEGMTYKLRLTDITQVAELLSDDTLMVKQLDPQDEIKFQLEFRFPSVPKASALGALMDNQEELTGNIIFTFEYLNVSSTANPSSVPEVYNNIALPPVDFLILVSRSMTAGIGLIFLMFCGIVALGFFGWWISRSEPYELELDGQPTHIWLSRIMSNTVASPSGEIIGTIHRGLFGGCKITARRGLQINGKEKSAVLRDKGGNVTIDGDETQGYFSATVSLRQLREKNRRKPEGTKRRKGSADTEFDFDDL